MGSGSTLLPGERSFCIDQKEVGTGHGGIGIRLLPGELSFCIDPKESGSDGGVNVNTWVVFLYR